MEFISDDSENYGSGKIECSNTELDEALEDDEQILLDSTKIYSSFDFSYEFTMGPMKIREESNLILRQIRERKLKFPLSRYFLKREDIKTMTQKFRDYKPTWVERSHRELKSHEGNWWLPSKFKGIPRQLITNKDDWWEIDVVVDYFTEYERIKARKEYSCSMQVSWNNDEVLLQAIISCKKDGVVNAKTLRNAMFYTCKELALFRVTRAKSFLQGVLFNDFEGTTIKEFSGKRWLDISAGWGDRLYTSCILGMDYIGFDPNTNLKYGHDEIIGMFGSKDEDGVPRQKVYYEPFEKSAEIIQSEVKRNGLFDVALCSPPFWIIERYNGKEQSTKNYREFDVWMVEFLFTSLYITWNNLKEGGCLVINIANIRDCDIVGPMQLFIEEHLNNTCWEGIITFSGRSTQNAPGSLYCWRKTESSSSTCSSGEYTMSDNEESDTTLSDNACSPENSSSISDYFIERPGFNSNTYEILSPCSDCISKVDLNTMKYDEGQYNNTNFTISGYTSPRYSSLKQNTIAPTMIQKSSSIQINKRRNRKSWGNVKQHKNSYYNYNDVDKWANLGRSRSNPPSPEKKWKRSPENRRTSQRNRSNSNSSDDRWSPRKEMKCVSENINENNIWDPKIKRSLTKYFPHLSTMWRENIRRL